MSNNLVLLCGHISGEPTQRQLASGTSLVHLDLSTVSDGATISVPVVIEASVSSWNAGDDVVVVGSVRRRFFRAGGATQSRTEVVADAIVPARRAKTVERLVSAAIAEFAVG